MPEFDEPALQCPRCAAVAPKIDEHEADSGFGCQRCGFAGCFGDFVPQRIMPWDQRPSHRPVRATSISLGVALALGSTWPRAAIRRGLALSLSAALGMIVWLVAYWYLASLAAVFALRVTVWGVTDWTGTAVNVAGLDRPWWLPWQAVPVVSPVIGAPGSDATGWCTAGMLGLALCALAVSCLVRHRLVQMACRRVLCAAVLLVIVQPIYLPVLMLASLTIPTAPTTAVGLGVVGLVMLAAIWGTRAIPVRPLPLKA